MDTPRFKNLNRDLWALSNRWCEKKEQAQNFFSMERPLGAGWGGKKVIPRTRSLPPRHKAPVRDVRGGHRGAGGGAAEAAAQQQQQHFF